MREGDDVLCREEVIRYDLPLERGPWPPLDECRASWLLSFLHVPEGSEGVSVSLLS